MDLEKARSILLDWKIDSFYQLNKRLPDEFEEEQLEMEITEDELRDAAKYLNEIN